MQIEKALTNERLGVSKVSLKFCNFLISAAFSLYIQNDGSVTN